LLDVHRASRFITYALENDLQVKIHRSTALSLCGAAISRRGDVDLIEFSAEKFDKVMTFLSQNDQQVHYATATQTVGVYAIVRLLGELRRQLRDYEREGYEPNLGSGPPMLTPRGPPSQRDPQGSRPRVPGLDLHGLGGQETGQGDV